MFSTILLPPRAQLCIRYCSNCMQVINNNVKQAVQLSDDNFVEITHGRFKALDLHLGVEVSVRWETQAFEVCDSRLGTEFSTQYKFLGLTTVFVPDDFSGTLTYSCSGCTGSGTITLTH